MNTNTPDAASSEEPRVFLSVVIPAFNEVSRIPSSLQQIVLYLTSLGKPYEIVVVDDGSMDGTAAVIEEVCGESQFLRLIRNAVNSGKGAAVRQGVLEARGEYILFTDADLSAPITEANRLLEPLQSGGYDIVIGSRALRREWIGVHQSWFRETAGKIFNFFIRLLTGLPFHDTQCGFKAFRREAADAVFPQQTIAGFGFDVEILYLASKFRFKTLETPVHWNHSAATKVRFLRDSIGMLWDLFKIRSNDWKGLYAYPNQDRQKSV